MTTQAEPEASGRFNLRLPPGLHRELQRRVEAGEANSLNTLCVSILAGAVGWKPGAPAATQKRGRR